MLAARFAALFAVLLLVGFGTSVAAAQKTIKQKMNTWLPQISTLYHFFALPLVERVRDLTNNRVEIAPYPAGAITPSSEELQIRSEAATQLASDCCSPV